MCYMLINRGVVVQFYIRLGSQVQMKLKLLKYKITILCDDGFIRFFI